jgi:hypothetical protein
MLLFVTSVKLLAEIALMALLGQFVLGLLAGAKRETNLFYQLLKMLTDPFVKATRFISPKFVLDRHVPMATFVLVLMVWMAATLMKINLCVQLGREACR